MARSGVRGIGVMQFDQTIEEVMVAGLLRRWWPIWRRLPSFAADHPPGVVHRIGHHFLSVDMFAYLRHATQISVQKSGVAMRTAFRPGSLSSISR
jgi:hypothetical protein